MFADDLILLSETSYGLQKSLLTLECYCNKWHFSVNVAKTKIIVFNKRYDLITSKFTINGKVIEIVKTHVYLEIEFSSSGNFKISIEKLFNMASKALIPCAKTTL